MTIHHPLESQLERDKFDKKLDKLDKKLLNPKRTKVSLPKAVIVPLKIPLYF